MTQERGIIEGLYVRVKDNNIELALKKLKKKMKNSGILIEYKDRMYFEKPSSKKRKKNKLSKLRAKLDQRKNI